SLSGAPDGAPISARQAAANRRTRSAAAAGLLISNAPHRERPTAVPRRARKKSEDFREARSSTALPRNGARVDGESTRRFGTFSSSERARGERSGLLRASRESGVGSRESGVSQESRVGSRVEGRESSRESRVQPGVESRALTSRREATLRHLARHAV